MNLCKNCGKNISPAAINCSSCSKFIRKINKPPKFINGRKLCSKCNLWKNKSDFYTDKDQRGGLCCACKKCCQKSMSLVLKNKWRKDNHETVIYCRLRNRSKQRNIFCDLTVKDFKLWYKSQKQSCIYCNISQEEWIKSKDLLVKIFKKLQIDRKEPKKGYTISNLVIACPRCNLTKSDFFTFNQMKQIGKIVHKIRKNV